MSPSTWDAAFQYAGLYALVRENNVWGLQYQNLFKIKFVTLASEICFQKTYQLRYCCNVWGGNFENAILLLKLFWNFDKGNPFWAPMIFFENKKNMWVFRGTEKCRQLSRFEYFMKCLLEILIKCTSWCANLFGQNAALLLDFTQFKKSFTKSHNFPVLILMSL